MHEHSIYDDETSVKRYIYYEAGNKDTSYYYILLY